MLTTPGLGLVFWTSITFLLLVVLLRKFAWKPIIAAIQKRNQTIDEALHAAEKARQDMAQLQVDNDKLIREAKKERDVILAEARKMSEKIVEEAGVKAREEGERILQSARDSINYEKMAAMTELKNQIAIFSLEIAEKILEENLTGDAKQQELAQKMVKEISFN